MAKKKEPETPKTKEEEILEEKVDAMMDIRPEHDLGYVGPRESSPGIVPDKPTATTREPELPPLDIFAGAQSAPELPKDLLKDTDIKAEEPVEPVLTVKATAEPEAEEAITEPAPPIDLDDAANNAAVDDIVAHEDDEAADELNENDTPREPVGQPAQKHHHPVFWAIITVIAVIAVVTAVLLASGGNLNFPGGKQLQNLFNSISGK